MEPQGTRIDETASQWLSRDRLSRSALLVVVTFLLLTVAHHFGAIASAPLWTVLASLLVTYVAAISIATRFPLGTDRARPRLFLIVVTPLCGLFVYTTGWGANLSIALLAAAVVVLQADGSEHEATAIVTIVVTICAGEAAIAFGLLPTLIPAGTVHGIAVVEAALAVIVVSLVARGQRDKERAEARERGSEERFRALVQYASDAIVVVGDDGTVLYASPAVEQVLGCPPTELRSFDARWIDDDHSKEIRDVWQQLRSHPNGVATVDVPIRHADGGSRWVEVHLTNLLESPAVGGVVCNLRDIGERRLAQQKLMDDALHDPLTRLPNRRLFRQRLDELWRRAQPDDHLAVVFLDVDDFKKINDRYGHATGDQTLVTVAQVLTDLIRSGDLVARHGGDEFTILLDRVEPGGRAHDFASRVREALCREWRLNGHDIDLSVSIGVATSRVRTASIDALVQQADEEMYRAKRSRCTFESRTL